MNKKQTAIFQELDSDDELPDVYTDATILPAYLIDNRFDDIKFDWIHKSNPKRSHTQEEQIKKNREIYEPTIHHKQIYMRGVLKHQDLYCLRAVEPFTCSSTLIWFVNFLLHKDLQSRFKYLKSCLVKDHVYTNLLSKVNGEERLKSTQRNKYEIVIKN